LLILVINYTFLGSSAPLDLRDWRFHSCHLTSTHFRKQSTADVTVLAPVLPTDASKQLYS